MIDWNAVMPEKNETDLLSDDDRSFAASMQQEREQRGWSQGQLADRLAVAGFPWLTRVTVSRIESLRRAARLGEAEAIASTLGTSVSAMISPNIAELIVLQSWEAAISPAWGRWREMQTAAAKLGESLAKVREARGHIAAIAADPDSGAAQSRAVNALERIDNLLARDPLAAARTALSNVTAPQD